MITSESELLGHGGLRLQLYLPSRVSESHRLAQTHLSFQQLVLQRRVLICAIAVFRALGTARAGLGRQRGTIVRFFTQLRLRKAKHFFISAIGHRRTCA